MCGQDKPQLQCHHVIVDGHDKDAVTIYEGMNRFIVANNCYTIILKENELILLLQEYSYLPFH